MLIPQYWYEAEITYRNKYRHDVRIRRLGWSETSQDDAKNMAEQRCQQALQKKRSGEDIAWREQKIAYNGADGMPIREELVLRKANSVVTRNSYGALCLNTPDVLFVDVDFAPVAVKTQTPRFVAGWIGGLLMGAAYTFFSGDRENAGLYITAGVAFGVFIALMLWMLLRSRQERLKAESHGKLEEERQTAFLEKVSQHAKANPAYHWRVYRTPHGMRLMATHALFEPGSKEVEECFRYFDADPLYASMCRLQKCFRARVSPKPWRMHNMMAMEPRQVWPLEGDDLSRRCRWVEDYEKASLDYAACRYIKSIGRGHTARQVRETIALHDELSGAESGKPIA